MVLRRPEVVMEPIRFRRTPGQAPDPDTQHLPLPGLNELLGADSARTLFVRIEGEQMAGAGLHDGDLLVVDKDAPIRPGSIVLARQHEDLFVARTVVHEGLPYFAFEPTHGQQRYPAGQSHTIVGVVTWAIRSLER